MSFEDDLFEGMPLHEAATCYIGLLGAKTAGPRTEAVKRVGKAAVEGVKDFGRGAAVGTAGIPLGLADGVKDVIAPRRLSRASAAGVVTGLVGSVGAIGAGGYAIGKHNAKKEKTAADAALEVFSELGPEDRAMVAKEAAGSYAPQPVGQLKVATMPAMGPPGVSTPGLPAAAKGMNMGPATPPPLPSAGMGQHTSMGAKMGSDDSVEKGRERARGNAASHFEKEKFHKGERVGEATGRMLGAAGGVLAGSKLMPGRMGQVGGGLIGQHFGARAGKFVGAGRDEKAFEKKHASPGVFAGATLENAQRLGKHIIYKVPSVAEQTVKKLATSFKLALDEMGIDPPQDPGPNGVEAGMDPGPMEMGGEPEQPEPTQADVDPETQAYLQNEQEADQAANQGHADFLRDKLHEAQAELQAAQKQMQAGSDAQMQHDQQLQALQQQVGDAATQASQAQDQALANQQAAAAMRMAYQQLRGQILQITSSDPAGLTPNESALAGLPGGAPGGAPPGQDPNAAAAGGAPPGAPPAADPAAAAAPAPPDPAAAGGAPPDPAAAAAPAPEPAGGGDKSKGKSVSLKVGHAIKMASLKHRAVNAALGGAATLGTSAAAANVGQKGLGDRISKLEANGDRGAGGDLALLQAKGRKALGGFAEKHPGAYYGGAAAGGALLGALDGRPLRAPKSQSNVDKNLEKMLHNMKKG